MKKIRKFFKELWLDKDELLKALAYLITFGWFAYIVRMVYSSDGGILGKVFFTVWSLVLAILFLAYKSNNDRDIDK